MSFLYIALIGILAGFIAGKIMKGKGFGLIINLILGVVGSFIGGWLLGIFGLSLGSGLIGTLITATIGAIVLIFGVNLVKGKK